ncbi:hypothetical protein EII12_02060 [Buchananella hordeovulneris]|uniref:hypothetical protein n=1 Tax=Buchananella hordeovulneris TaxID=52770 RepID=UPI000F5D545E|nr:hypothetical protein [Buchananella hordeovulneris]RRD53434.1 hypothetical protein EII12_02060 [Buchananella hordeovulneris]
MHSSPRPRRLLVSGLCMLAATVCLVPLGLALRNGTGHLGQVLFAVAATILAVEFAAAAWLLRPRLLRAADTGRPPSASAPADATHPSHSDSPPSTSARARRLLALFTGLTAVAFVLLGAYTAWQLPELRASTAAAGSRAARGVPLLLGLPFALALAHAAVSWRACRHLSE